MAFARFVILTPKSWSRTWKRGREAHKPETHKPETCRERLKREKPKFVCDDEFGGCVGCPQEYGYVKEAYWKCWVAGRVNVNEREAICRECWDRPVEEDSKEEK